MADKVAFELVSSANSAEFEHPETQERVDLLAGDQVVVDEEYAPALDAKAFLKRAGEDDPEDVDFEPEVETLPRTHAELDALAAEKAIALDEGMSVAEKQAAIRGEAPDPEEPEEDV